MRWLAKYNQKTAQIEARMEDRRKYDQAEV
jgi:hypothetical protein